MLGFVLAQLELTNCKLRLQLDLEFSADRGFCKLSSLCSFGPAANLSRTPAESPDEFTPRLGFKRPPSERMRACCSSNTLLTRTNRSNSMARQASRRIESFRSFQSFQTGQLVMEKWRPKTWWFATSGRQLDSTRDHLYQALERRLKDGH